MLKDLYARWLDAESQAAYDLQYVPNGHERIHAMAVTMGEDLLSPEEIREEERERRRLTVPMDEIEEDEEPSGQPKSKYTSIPYGMQIFHLTKAAQELMKEYVIDQMTKPMRDGLAAVAENGPFHTSRHTFVEFCPSLRGWDVEDIVRRWDEKHR